MKNHMARFWVNQPSTLQQAHTLHGLHVIAPQDLAACGNSATVYFVRGPVISALISPQALSPGWPRQTCPAGVSSYLDASTAHMTRGDADKLHGYALTRYEGGVPGEPGDW